MKRPLTLVLSMPLRSGCAVASSSRNGARQVWQPRSHSFLAGTGSPSPRSIVPLRQFRQRSFATSSQTQPRGQPEPKRTRPGQTLLLIVVPALGLLAYALNSDGGGSLSSVPSSFLSTSSASSSSAGKLDSYTHSPIPIASLSFYPLPQSPSEHKHISISLPAGTFSSSSGTTQPLTPQDQLRIRSIYIKEPSLVIERGYTPLYDTLQGSSSLALPQLSSRGSLELIVKRYADGELSRYLHRLPPGSNVEVRGPVDTWNLKRDHGEDAPVPNEIVMLVGGTGITPAYQLLTNVLGRPSTGHTKTQTTPETKFKLVYAVPDTQNALLLPELSSLVQAHPEQVSLTLLVERLEHDARGRVTVPPQRPLDSSGLTLASEVRVIMASNGASRVSWNPMSWFRSASIPASAAGQGPAQDVAIQAHQARFNPTLLQSLLAGPKPNGDQDPRYLIVLVCGPDGMVNYLAGPKSRDGRTQGPLGGLLAQLGYTQEQVYKL